MALINPYLNFNGNTEEVFDFYKSVFGGDYGMVMRFKDAPAEHQMGTTDLNQIMHISLRIGHGTILMGSDVPEMYGKVVQGTDVQLSISADTREEADKLFRGLSAGGQVTMPMSDTFWGSYFGMFKDKFGIEWMVSFDKKYAG